jgi:hypothetical protein
VVPVPVRAGSSTAGAAMSAGALSRLVQTLEAHRDVLGALNAEPRSLNSIARGLGRTNGPAGRHLGALQMMGIAERADGGWRLASGGAAQVPLERPPESEVEEIEDRIASLPTAPPRAKPAQRCECRQPIIDDDGCAKCGRPT